MITHKLKLFIAGHERPQTICADHCVVNEANEVEFYDANDHCFAIIPAAIIIEHIES